MEETIEKAISAVFILDPVKCTKEEWPTVREALKNWAEKGIANGPPRREKFVLAEIERLDRKFAS
jgi:hypothetical protein